MMLRQPSFWYDTSPMAVALSPLSALWRLGGMIRYALAKPYTSSIPVICIGNISVGGTGKTPTAIAVAAALKHKRVCFLTRGYGGSHKSPVIIDRATDASLYGDEAILLSHAAPTIVARDRVAGLKLAEANGFAVVIADDGFQNPNFTKTLSLLVVDGTRGIGNGRVMPAGPLRELPAGAKSRADGIVIIGDDTAGIGATFAPLPVLRGDFAVADGAPDKATPYVAFAGIGQPDKFFTTLRDHGYTVAESVSFPDHYPYRIADIDRLARLAARHNAQLITTTKDHVRLPESVRPGISALPVTLTLQGDVATLLAKAVP